MDVSWGSWQYDGSRRKRLGYEFSQSPATVTSATSSVSVTLRIYLETNWGIFDTVNSFGVSGGTWSRSGSVDLDQSNGDVVQIFSQAQNISTVYGSTVTRSFSSSLSGIEAIGGTCSASGSHTVVARPFAAPSAATDVTVSRTSDTQHGVAWTNNSTGDSSTSAPYESQQVQRYDNVAATWSTIATVSGAATSYTDTTTQANRRYEYRVRATNSSGSATSTASSAVQTTPATPTSAAAVKSGSDIVVTYTRNASSGMTVGYEIHESQDGGAYSLLATVGDVATYTHVAPSASVTHRYQVRSKSTVGATTYSGYSTTETVILATPPNAPSGLVPNGTAQNAAADIIAAWVHSSPDTSPQSKFQIRHRESGAGSWTEVAAVTSGISSWTLPADTYANGTSVEWEVRTWGTHADPSVYSATATFDTSTPPTATINSPADAATVTTSTLSAGWGYYDAESTAQSEWQARLLDDASALVEFRSAIGTATETTFDEPIADEATYTLEVRVRDASGLWSAWDSVTFDVSYLPPEDVDLDATYDADSGVMVLALTPGGTIEDVSVDAVSARIQRSIDGGAWVTIATVGPDATVLDMIPATRATNSYRVTATSALPSSKVMTAVDAVVSELKWAFLNYGPGFGKVLKFYGNLSLTSSAGIEQATEHFAGREDAPVLLTGEARSRQVGVGVTLDDQSSTRDEFEEAARTGGVMYYRDPSPRRIPSMLAPIATAQEWAPLTSLTISLTEVDHVG